MPLQLALIGSVHGDLDGQQMELEVYEIGGHNYIKLRDTGKAVGFNVDRSGERGVFLDATALCSFRG